MWSILMSINHYHDNSGRVCRASLRKATGSEVPRRHPNPLCKVVVDPVFTVNGGFTFYLSFETTCTACIFNFEIKIQSGSRLSVLTLSMAPVTWLRVELLCSFTRHPFPEFASVLQWPPSSLLVNLRTLAFTLNTKHVVGWVVLSTTGYLRNMDGARWQQDHCSMYICIYSII